MASPKDRLSKWAEVVVYVVLGGLALFVLVITQHGKQDPNAVNKFYSFDRG